ncbi:MAG: hypothetical protein K0Q72_1654 [Armatimonadetes bacterium]|jgi:hypothetical protein|nr:hypothetical protein [Armatimonadota bacterium]
MPPPNADRFSSQNMSDCEFCPPDGRRFRTMRQCSGCSKALCLVCRPALPALAFLCPECGGGEVENALHAPAAVIERLQAAGHTVPYWLLVAAAQGGPAGNEIAEELIIPA